MTLRAALKKAGYDPDLIIKEFNEMHGGRKVLKRKRKEFLTPKGEEVMKKANLLSDKAWGVA